MPSISNVYSGAVKGQGDEGALIIGFATTWAWSLPLIVINIVIRVLCLGLAITIAEHVLRSRQRHRGFISMFLLVISVIVTLATLLHGLEAAIWAVAYRLLDALPDNR